jgi:hypothetical protein
MLYANPVKAYRIIFHTIIRALSLPCRGLCISAGLGLEPYNKFSALFSKENLLSKALIQLAGLGNRDILPR